MAAAPGRQARRIAFLIDFVGYSQRASDDSFVTQPSPRAQLCFTRCWGSRVRRHKTAMIDRGKEGFPAGSAPLMGANFGRSGEVPHPACERTTPSVGYCLQRSRTLQEHHMVQEERRITHPTRLLHAPCRLSGNHVAHRSALGLGHQRYHLRGRALRARDRLLT